MSTKRRRRWRDDAPAETAGWCGGAGECAPGPTANKPSCDVLRICAVCETTELHLITGMHYM